MVSNKATEDGEQPNSQTIYSEGKGKGGKGRKMEKPCADVPYHIALCAWLPQFFFTNKARLRDQKWNPGLLDYSSFVYALLILHISS